MKRFGLCALMMLTACGSRPSATEAAHASLGGDTVARVGNVVISASLVEEIAKSQNVSADRALALVIDDALAAAGAEREGLDRTPEVVRARTAVLARKVVVRIRDAARTAGPPTDEEVNEVTEAHWTEVDLPERMRVIHVVVLKPKETSREPDAVALASTLAATLAQATSEDDFEARANATPHAGIDIKVERLDPFVADGRRPEAPGSSFDPAFAKAAASLAVGATSGVVRSAFGFHVIRMVERLPEHRVPFEERRRMFREEVEARRAHDAKEKLEESLVKRYPVTIANGVEALMTETTMNFLGVERAPEAPTP